MSAAGVPPGSPLEHVALAAAGGGAPAAHLPSDRRRPPTPSFRRAAAALPLGDDASRLLLAARSDDAPPDVALLAAGALVVGRHAGRTDVTVAIPIAPVADADGRARAARLARVPLDLGGDADGGQLLARAAAATRGAATQVEDGDDGAPLPILLLTRDLDGAQQFDPSAVAEQVARSDIALGVRRRGDALELTADYDAELFEPATVRRLLSHVRAALTGLLTRPGERVARLPLLGDEERMQLTVAWNETAADLPDGVCVHELVERQADRTPDRVALRWRGEALTYAELDRRANRLAHRLIARGVGSDTLVGLALERTPSLVVAMLATLKAGGAYVPLDPAYPAERLAYMVRDAEVAVLVRDAGVTTDAWAPASLPRLAPDAPAARDDRDDRDDRPAPRAAPTSLAYVIYTSGSTGLPKGVMVEHRNVVNFCVAMGRTLGEEPGVWLALTSLSFDISVLELLWPLTTGSEIVLHALDGTSTPAASPAASRTPASRALETSLFYFASDDSADASAGRGRYRLLLEGARFADEHGFAAVWTPERHFHAFGGLYPSPSVTSAALASITRRVQIRAGSVVLPLHDPVRVAEEWAVIDNLCDGRSGVSFASGWQPEDFVFAPEHYADRHEVMFRGIDTIRRLWRGETITRPGAGGRDVAVRLRPRPVQPELPTWVTAGGTSSTFRRAGEIGASVLTHLLGQSLAELAEKIGVYRDAWRAGDHDAGRDDRRGHVTLMLHAFLGEDEGRVRDEVRGPLTRYLRGSVSLFTPFAAELGLDVHRLSERDLDAIAEHAFERYFTTSGLFGTPTGCLPLLEHLREIGVDEIACLIDFGIPVEAALRGLPRIDEMRTAATRPARLPSSDGPAPRDDSLASLIRRHGVTHLQATPSLIGALAAAPETLAALGSLRTLLVGGEALPAPLAATLAGALRDGRVVNMYGPTETTIWSATFPLPRDVGADGVVPIGRPIANTRLHIVDAEMRPVPIGVPGELLIGGAGVARGYLRRPELTAERFFGDPVLGSDAGRVYRTGDMARYRADGTVEFLGRVDDQVKIRGHRIELGEVESVLRRHPSVLAAAATVLEDHTGGRTLAAYLVPTAGSALDVRAVRAHATRSLPPASVPTAWVVVSELPLTPNGKLDRRALPAPDPRSSVVGDAFEGPVGETEHAIEECWRAVLKRERIDVRESFFAIGGHSLLVMHVLNQLSARLGRPLSMADMFRHPTIRGYAAFLAATDAAAGTDPPPALRAITPRPRISTTR